jgi:hypothetical protein
MAGYSHGSSYRYGLTHVSALALVASGVVSGFGAGTAALRGAGVGTATAAGATYASTTLRVGRETRAGAGAVPLTAQALGILISGTAPTTWTLTKLSGSASWPATVTTGLTPAPVSTLTSATDAGTQAVYDIVADGAATGQTLTINVQPAAEAAGALTVASKAEIATTLGGIKATLGGKRIEIQVGSDASWRNAANSSSGGAADIMNFTQWNTHSGVITVTASDPARKPLIGRLMLVTSNNLRITGLSFSRAILSWPESGLTSAQHANNQNVSCFQMTRSTGLAACAFIEVDNNTFGAAVGSNPTQWITGLNIIGALGFTAQDLTIRNNTFTRVKGGVAIGGAERVAIRNNLFRYGCSDFINLGGDVNAGFLIENNQLYAPMNNPADLADHADFCQIGSTSAAADYTGLIVRYNVFDMADGDTSAQGPFVNDIAFSSAGTGALLTNGQKLTGFFANNCEIYNNIYVGGHVNGPALDVGTGWVVRNNTSVRAKAAGSTEPMSDPTFRAARVVESASGTPRTSQGVSMGNIAHQIPANGSVEGLTSANDLALGALPSASRDEPARLALLSPIFQDPGNADVLLAYRPVANAAAFIAAGRYRGALNPDGSWADARTAGAVSGTGAGSGAALAAGTGTIAAAPTGVGAGTVGAAGAGSGNASVPGATATSIAVAGVTVTTQYHIPAGSALTTEVITAVPANVLAVTNVTDMRGLADASNSTSKGPLVLTDGLGRKFLRFTNMSTAYATANALATTNADGPNGPNFLNINAALLPSSRAMAVFMVMRQHRSGTMNFFNLGGANPGGPMLGTNPNNSGSAPFIRAGSRYANAQLDGDSTKTVMGAQMQVIGVVGRTAAGVANTADTGMLLYHNNNRVRVPIATAATAVSSCTIGTAAGVFEFFDLYEVVVVNSVITDAQANAVQAALVANWQIPAVTDQLILEGDSITAGVLAGSGTAGTGVLSSAQAAMVLTEPGAELVPKTCRVINLGVSGASVADLVTRRDAAGGLFTASGFLSGGRNIVSPHIGRNNWVNTVQSGTDTYTAIVALISQATTGYLPRGFEVVQAINIANSGVTLAWGQQRTLLRAPAFLTDCGAGAGQAYDGKLTRLELPLITVGGVTRFDTAANAGTADYQDGTHPTRVSTAWLATGGGTPANGYGAII